MEHLDIVRLSLLRVVVGCFRPVAEIPLMDFRELVHRIPATTRVVVGWALEVQVNPTLGQVLMQVAAAAVDLVAVAAVISILLMVVAAAVP